MLVYVTLKPTKVVVGFDQETTKEDSVTLLKTISVAGSGPGEKKQGCLYPYTDSVPGNSGGIMHY